MLTAVIILSVVSLILLVVVLVVYSDYNYLVSDYHLLQQKTASKIDGINSKIKGLESSPLFDCENGRHHWLPWEDLDSQDTGRVTQSRRCGECNKLEYAEVAVIATEKISSQEITPWYSERVVLQDSVRQGLGELEPFTNDKDRVQVFTNLGRLSLYADQAHRVHVRDGFLIWTSPSGDEFRLRSMDVEGGEWELVLDGESISGDYKRLVEYYRPAQRESIFKRMGRKEPFTNDKNRVQVIPTLPCYPCGGYHPYDEFVMTHDGSRHIPPDIGRTSHSPNKPRSANERP